ncbi:conserved exported protein of unknown function [Thermococcus nautili]|uniref:DUF2202 domain-containing protein n=1 Tax=Thermococcus nautili TaxID=195522 RepID=UPI0025534F81|nr:DUF2202 domain-containing protein [Thermococcus nautili]CAI1494074.1 conserved exported protein of unknown function [Thermococcus nautili]
MKKMSFLLVALLLLATVGAGCITSTDTSTTQGPPETRGPPEDKGYGAGASPEGTMVNVSAYPAQNLSQDEIEAILYMREEEKLARDVYLTLYNKTGLPIFSNIANSEQTHMDMVLELIEKYNLTDPVAGMGIGEFNSTEMQELYEKLVAQGSESEVEALKVGALIEEIDIKDLDEWLKRTDNEDIKAVFESLRSGSENHLRAFTRLLQNRYGVTYTPQVLSEEEYKSIVG